MMPPHFTVGDRRGVGLPQAGEQWEFMGWLQGDSRAADGRTGGVFHCEIGVQAGILLRLAKEQFFYPATQPLFKALEQLSQRSGVNRGQACKDWLTAMVCTCGGEEWGNRPLVELEYATE